MNIFNRKKHKDDCPNTWVFEHVHVNFLNKKAVKIGVIVVFLLVTMLYYFLLSCYFDVEKMKAVIICSEIILAIVICWNFTTRIVNKYWPMIVIPLIALSITIVVVNIYPDRSMQIQRADILSFCGDFLTFLGAFCLGYFIYIQDRMRIIEEKRTKVKLLNALIASANTELIGLGRLKNMSDEYYKDLKNQGLIHAITYDPNWLMYYYEYEALRGENYELGRTLEHFFDFIVNINTAIGNEQIERAIKIYDRHIDYENYSFRKYNTSEASLYLLDACVDFHYDRKSWLEVKKTVNLINELCRKYYFIIENYVYNWLIKHRICTTTEEYDLQREIVDWLLTKSPEIKGIIKFPSEKRIISKVVFDCSLKFSSKSKKVDYVWGEYSLK